MNYFHKPLDFIVNIVVMASLNVQSTKENYILARNITFNCNMPPVSLIFSSGKINVKITGRENT
jgi:hypothetical protein